MDPATLDDRGRADLLAFFGEVFGWTEGDNTGEPGNPLIMYTGAFGEFVYLLPGDPFLTAPALDHFGYQVASLDRAPRDRRPRPGVRRARRAGARRSTCTRARRTARTHDYTLTSAYIGFVLPLMIELQHLERHHAVADLTHAGSAH